MDNEIINPEDDWNEYCRITQVVEDQEDYFCRHLVAFQIAATFPDECKEYIPKAIQSLNIKLKLLKGKDQAIINQITKYEQVMRIINSDMSEITEVVIERANKVPIQELFDVRKGNMTSMRISCLCPFHVEDHGSFIIYKNNNTYYCFGACGHGGDAVDFIMRLNKVSFKQAVQYLIKKG